MRTEKVCSWLRIRGNADFERSPEIRHILLEAVAGMRNVLVDLSEVTYIDNSGIACLVEALQMARKHGAEFGLISVNTQAMRLLELARLNTVFPILNDVPIRLRQVARPLVADHRSTASRCSSVGSWRGAARSRPGQRCVRGG